MITQKSDEPGPTAHPDDVANLAKVKEHLADALTRRINRGVSSTFISQSLGHHRDFMNQVLEPYTRPEMGWMYDNFLDLTEGCMCVPRLDLWGLNGVTSPMWQIARTSSTFLAVGAVSVLKEVRLARGVTYTRVGELMGVHRSQVQRLEESDNPHMGSVQRLARALDCIARFRVVRSWKGDEFV